MISATIRGEKELICTQLTSIGGSRGFLLLQVSILLNLFDQLM